MLNKLLLSLLLLTCLTGMVYGQSWEETIGAGKTDYRKKNFSQALSSFEQALTLTSNNTEIAVTKEYIGRIYGRRYRWRCTGTTRI